MTENIENEKDKLDDEKVTDNGNDKKESKQLEQKDFKKLTEKQEEKQLEGNNKTFCHVNEKRLQLCAWLLLTVGLCIVITAFYMAIQQNTSCQNQNSMNNTADAGNIIDAVDDAGADLQVNPSNSSGQLKFENEEPSRNITGRYIGFFEILNANVSACQEQACQVTCKNVANIYASLDEALQASTCLTIDQVVLEKQAFPLGVLKNSWLPANISVHELIIRWGNISRIRNNAFNAQLFKNTFALTLSHMNIKKVYSGALLGLFSLKYLTIKSNILRYEPAIFQPVQTTLMNLKLNANIRINGQHNPFDKSYLPKLLCLDLSNNRFNGSLSRNLFKSTPNLKYLTIVDSQIQHIEEDAFEDLQGKLTFINLAHNQLTFIGPAVLQTMLKTPQVVLINLANNDWLCNCDLLALTGVYRKYRQQFMDILYCKAPYDLYGLALDELNYDEQNCATRVTTEQQEIEEVKGTESDTTEISASSSSATSVIENNTDFMLSSEKSSVESNPMLKMRCLNRDASDEIRSPRSSELITDANVQLLKQGEEDSLEIPVPNYNFELQLLEENNTAIVTIENPSQLLVIWFNESPLNYNDTSCMLYAKPQLLVGPLESNTTYTFCLLAAFKNDISPFDCLPLHVPAKRQENIWISEDNKGFTIGMLCLIFLLSIIAGGLIAYFGIKTYPDLLEGSKNVLVVKKPDQACYVATISEMEYQKQSSMKKKKPSALKKQSSIKLPLPDTPPSENSPTPFPMSVKDLERLSSLKSSSTCFEDTFPSYNFADDEYETPKVCSDEYKIDQRCVENIYGMSPKSPPPLPKRNSNVSNTATLVINRFSSKVD